MPEEHPETEIISVTQDGGSAGNSLSRSPSISAHGRWVAFASEATNLTGAVPGDDDDDDTPGDDDETPISSVANIYVKDYWTGEIELITRPLGGTELDTSAFMPRISRDPNDPENDGRWVVFHTASRNIVGGVTNPHNDVYLYDRKTKKLDRVSLGLDGQEGNQGSQNASVSADGRYVVFESDATNLLPGDTNRSADIFLFDRDWEQEGTPRLRRVNVTANGGQALGGHSRNPRISSDGKQIVFESLATNLVSPAPEVWEIYVHNRDANRTGILDEIGGISTVRLSAQYTANGGSIASDGHSRQPDLSPDGRFVVFHSEATNLFAEPARGEIVLTGRGEETTLRFAENQPASGTIGFHPDTFASGTIAFGDRPADQETLTISDGVASRTFEFDGPNPDGVAAGNVRVIIGSSVSSTRANLVGAINSAFLINGEQTIRAVADTINGQPGVRLTNLAYGPSVANQAIDGSNAPTLTVSGMDGAAVTLPASGDTLEIDNGRLPPVTVVFFDEGEADPTDYGTRILGVEIGRTANETALNLWAVMNALGYREYDIPSLPVNLLPPVPANPEHGDSFTLVHNGREHTFFFVDNGPQFDPANPSNVRIGGTPAATRGNLLRSINAMSFNFDPLPAIWESSGESVGIGSLLSDAPAEGTVRLRQVPEDGHRIIISDGVNAVTFRFDDERELTEEEEENGIEEVPPFEVVSGTLVRVYLIEDVTVAQMNQRLLGAIQASNLNITARGVAPIQLLNNEIGSFGNVLIEINPMDEVDPDEEPDPDADPNLVETEWAVAYGMANGADSEVEAGDRIVFYPENLLHPTVVFEFGPPSGPSSPGVYPVALGRTGSETEGNFLAALYESGLPWLIAEQPDPEQPSVVLESNVGTAAGQVAFNFSASNPGAFASLDNQEGAIRTPQHGGRVVINDGLTPPVTFQFSADGSVEEDGFVPVEIAATAEVTRNNLQAVINQFDGLSVIAEQPDSDFIDLVIENLNRGPLSEPMVALRELGGAVSIVSEIPGGWNPLPGEAFRISDGTNATVFEFVAPGGTPTQAEYVGILTAAPGDLTDQRSAIRDRIIGAVKSAGLALLATPFTDGNDPAVLLVHTEPGAGGNHAIQIVSDHASFSVLGMEGGGNLAPGTDQVYIVDRDVNENGVFDETGQMLTELVTVTELGTAGNRRSLEATVSGDGRFIAFQSLATDLLPMTVTRSDGEVFPSLPNSGLFSGGEEGSPLVGYEFWTDEIASYTDSDVWADIYLYDREERKHTRVSINRFGEANLGGWGTVSHPHIDRAPAISVNGGLIVFESDQESGTLGSGLAHGVTNQDIKNNNGYQDVFIHDRRLPEATWPTLPGEVAIQPITGGENTYPLGAPVSLVVEVSDLPEGRVIEQVQFFANGILIGTTTSPMGASLDLFSINWTPDEAGSYWITAIATDNHGRTILLRNPMNIIVVPVQGISAPTVSIVSPSSGEVITDSSSMLLVARAADTDGSLEGVQFYVNGDKYGPEIPRGPEADGGSYPYSIRWSPDRIGNHVITAVARDNSGNRAAAAPVVVSVIEGSNAPSITMTAPNRNAEAVASVGGGSVSAITVVDGGEGYVTAPEVVVRGNGTGAAAEAVIDPVTGQVTSVVITSGGSGYTQAPEVSFRGGFPVLRLFSDNQRQASGTVILNRSTGEVSNIVVLDGGAGYTSAPSVRIIGNGVDALATAQIQDGRVSAITIANPGRGFSQASVVFEGGFALDPVYLEAEVEAQPGREIVSVEFFVNGLQVGGTRRSAPYQVTWNPLGRGVFLLTAVATDDRGNKTVADPIIVEVGAREGYAPDVVILHPEAGQSVSSRSTMLFSARASDADGEIVRVVFYANGIILGNAEQQHGTDNWVLVSELPMLGSGSYTIRAVATDNAGNVSHAAPREINVVASSGPVAAAPTLSVNPSALRRGQSTLLSLQPASTGATLASAQFFANGLLIGAVEAAPFNLTWVPPTDGEFTLVAIALDGNGNSVHSNSVEVVVAGNQLPTVSWVRPLPSDPATIGQAVELVVQASDADGSVVSVEFFADGALLGVGERVGITNRYRLLWIPLEQKLYEIQARATDDTGLVGIAPIRVIDTRIGDVTDPANASGFVTQMFLDILNRTPTASEFDSFVKGLRNGTITRVQLVEALLNHPEFAITEWIIAAYLTILGEPPTVVELEEAYLSLIFPPDDGDTGDDDDDTGDDDDVPVGLRGLVADILDSTRFFLKYGRYAVNMDADDLFDIVWDNTGRSKPTFAQKQQQVSRIAADRYGAIAALVDPERFGANVRNAALVLLLLERDTSNAELAHIARQSNPIEYILTRSDFADRFGANGNPFGAEPSDSPERYSPWFGRFNDTWFNYAAGIGSIKHAEHEWLYASVSENGIWMWDYIQEDWLWTNEDEYPFFYSDNRQEWLYYKKGGTPAERQFYSYRPGAGWFSVTK